MTDGGDRQETAGLTVLQERVAVALAGGMSIVGAAGEFDVGERTIYTWLKLIEFREVLDRTRLAFLDAALGGLAGSAADALATLRDLLAADQPPGARLGAAKAILDGLLRYGEQLDLAERVSKIEAALEESRHDNTRRGRHGSMQR